MKRTRLLLGVTMTLSLAAGAAFFVTSGYAGRAACSMGVEVAGSCARCGDGVCARSCENAKSCPQDCAPSTNTSK